METEAAKRGIARFFFTELPRSFRGRFLWAFSLVVLGPLPFEFLGLIIFHPLLLKFNEKQMEGAVTSGGTTRREFTPEWTELLVVVAAYIAFVLALSLLGSTALVYTTASFYTPNTQNSTLLYVRVPRLWKRLTLRFLCISIISLGVLAAFLLAIIILLIIFFPRFPAVGGKGFLLGVILLIIVVVFSLQLYISFVWYLNNVRSALNDKYSGLPPMPKSINIKENRTTAMSMIIPSIISSAYFGVLFWSEAVEGRSHGVGITAMAVYPTLLVGFLCSFNSMWMLMYIVLYFLCDLCHHGVMNDNLSFKVHNVDDHEPPNTSSNIELEHPHAEV